MSETLLIDCAWTKPSPAAVKAAGYVGVIGYISHDPTKDLTRTQARAYVEADLAVGLVFETTAHRATSGKSAGRTDRQFAEAEAHKRGYPTSCPIFYAVDGDYDPKTVAPYFEGAAAVKGTHPVGVYGSVRVVDAMLKAKHASVGWQTEAWSGTKLSRRAHLYQRTGKTVAAIKGVRGSAYDEDVVLTPFPLWGGRVAPPAPAPAKPKRVGFRLPVSLAIRLVTRRLNRRRQGTYTPHARALLVNLRRALDHALKEK